MTDTVANPSAGWRMKVAAFSLAVSIFAVIWFMVAALGTKFGLWSWQVGLGQMTMGIGPKIVGLACLLSLITIFISVFRWSPQYKFFVIGALITLQAILLAIFFSKFALALYAIAAIGVCLQVYGLFAFRISIQVLILGIASTFIAFLLLGRLFGMGVQAASLPPIHDIQTDWSEPISFSETLMADRTADGDTNPVLDAPIIEPYAKDNWPGMEGTLVSLAQEEAESKDAGKTNVYPALEPLYFSASPGDVASLVEKLIKKKGWKLVTPMPADTNNGDEFQIEATATSGWFGFKDDVAIRIRPVEGAVRVDMRSISRVGLSDLGANSKRVAGLMAELRERGNGRVDP